MSLIRIVGLAVAALTGWTGAVAAAGVDTGKPLICALLELSSCATGGDCERETPESANVPRFLFIDAKTGTIAGVRSGGQALTTTIQRQQVLGDLLVLEGVEGALSWTISVNRSLGGMNLGAVGDGVGFVVFGECTNGTRN